jgi:hypothetical protein
MVAKVLEKLDAFLFRAIQEENSHFFLEMESRSLSHCSKVKRTPDPCTAAGNSRAEVRLQAAS